MTERDVLPRADRRRRGAGTASSTSWSTMPAPTSARSPDILKLEEWRFVMDTNLTSAFVCSHAAYPHMKQAGGGKIINIGSMMSIFAAPLLAGLCGEQGRHRAVRALLRDRLGEGQHPGELDPAGLDQHRADAGRAARGAGAERARARRARRPAAGASGRISPASRCFSRARRRISSPARRSRSTAGSRCRGSAHAREVGTVRRG